MTSTPAGVMATRFSSALISLGMPTIMADILFLIKEALCRFLEKKIPLWKYRYRGGDGAPDCPVLQPSGPIFPVSRYSKSSMGVYPRPNASATAS